MIQELIAFNIYNLTTNMTAFQQVQAVTTQPYFLTSFVIVLALIVFVTLAIGFTHVSGNSNKVCFQSNVYWKTFLIPLLIGVLAFILLLIVPIWFNFTGG